MLVIPGEKRRQESVAASFGLRSGLRQGGGRFAAALFGTAEVGPFRTNGKATTTAKANAGVLRSAQDDDNCNCKQQIPTG